MQRIIECLIRTAAREGVVKTIAFSHVSVMFNTQALGYDFYIIPLFMFDREWRVSVQRKGNYRLGDIGSGGILPYDEEVGEVCVSLGDRAKKKRKKQENK